VNILFVCLGNICRSPLAEGIMQQKINQLGHDWGIDSAGTGSWHIGEAPDLRSRTVAQKHGINISRQRARQINKTDFDRFDIILVMDNMNFRDIINLAENEEQKKKVKLILDFQYPGKNLDIPDPYWNDNWFEEVFQLLDEACDVIIREHVDHSV
jgi:low molecular weight protein-tyrosine phosphatase